MSNSGRIEQNSSRAAEPWTLEEAFADYAKFGDENRNKGRVINQKNAVRWVRAAKILQFADVEEYDIRELLGDVSNDKPANFAQFEIFLDILAQIRGVDGSQLRIMLRSCGPPSNRMDLVSFLGVKDMWEYVNTVTQHCNDPKK